MVGRWRYRRSLPKSFETHRLKQAEEFLRLGIRQTDNTFIYTREAGEPLQPRSLSKARGCSQLPEQSFHASDVMTYATPTLRICWSSGVHPKVASLNALVHSQIGTAQLDRLFPLVLAAVADWQLKTPTAPR